MTSLPYISIIIPVYKVEPYIKRCLLSVMEQTYVSQPVECILIDDCGGDDSIKIAKECIKNYNGSYSFRIIENEQNKGLATTRTIGLKAAQGEYIFFLDSDDHIARDCLEALVGALNTYPDADVVIGNTYFVKEKRLIINEKYFPMGLVPSQLVLEAFFRGKILDIVWNMLVKTDIIHTYNLYFVDGIIHEDTNWTFRLYTKAKKIVFVPKTTLIYEDNTTSIVNSIIKNINPHLIGIVYNLSYILDHFPQSHYVDATLFLIKHLIRALDAIDKNHVKLELKKELKTIRNRVFRRDIANIRIILALFELQMYMPFRHIHKLSLYRRNYHRFSVVVRKAALFFDHIHIFSKS